jgi:hypothetical protein
MRNGISITVSRSDRRRLQALVADRNASQKHVWRAEIVLLTADGLGTNEVMRAKAEAEEGLKAKVPEKQAQIAAMRRQIEEPRRKSEQGSQQLRGEALELEPESLLRWAAFPAT